MASQQELDRLMGRLFEDALDGPAPLPARKADAIQQLRAEANEIEARIIHMELRDAARNQVNPEQELFRQVAEGFDSQPEATPPKAQLSFRQ